jgi:excinuclease ABC subunit A
MDEIPCPVCEGSRLKKEAQFFKIDEQNITDYVQWIFLT